MGAVEAALRPGVVCPVTADTQVGIYRDQEDNERLWNWGSAERIKLKHNQEFCLFQFDTRACAGQQVKKATLYLPRTEQCVLSRPGISTVSAEWEEGRGKGDPGELPLDEQGKSSVGGATFTHAVYPGRLWAGQGSEFLNVVLGEGNSLRGEARTGWARLDGQDYYWAELPPPVAQALLIPGFTHGLCVAEELGADSVRQGTPVFPNGGSFQNGIVNVPGQGAEFFDWNGNTSGYEGHLVYSWFLLQAVLTRQPEHLSRLYRPMSQTPPTRPAGVDPLTQ